MREIWLVLLCMKTFQCALEKQELNNIKIIVNYLIYCIKAIGQISGHFSTNAGIFFHSVFSSS